MRKFCYKSLAILLMITMLMTCLPLQVFAAQQSFEDRFKLYNEETGTFAFVDTGFPEVEIVFRD